METEEEDKRLDKALQLVEKRQAELRWVLSSEGGRNFLWRVLAYCGLFRTTSGTDPHNMAIRSGMRDVGIYILDEIMSADPDVFFKMQREARSRDDDFNRE